MGTHNKIAETDKVNVQTKVLLEIKKLQQDTSWQTRATAALWPIVAALFTGYVSFASYYSQKSEKHAELLNQAFVNATETKDGSASEARRIAGIWQLNEFWQLHDEQDETVIPSFLVEELSLKGDDNQNVRCAAVAVVGNLLSDKYIKAVGQKRFEQVRMLLFGDKEGAIGQLVSMNVRLRLQTQESRPVNECDKSLSVTPLDATREAIRMNWNYLRRANLQGTDLNGVRFYQSDLAYASLKHANLKGASFYCANLLGVNLEESDLSGADLSYANVNGVTFPREYKISNVPTLNMSDSEWREWSKEGFASNDSRLKDNELRKTSLPRSCTEMNEGLVGKSASESK